MTTPPPEVRQCQDPTSPHFGAVAVRSSLPGLGWGVFHPRHGGHWQHDDTPIADWTTLT